MVQCTAAASARPLTIALVLGTTREGRQGVRVARFCQRQLETAGHSVVTIDPLEHQLPLLETAYQHYGPHDLPRPPMLQRLGELINGVDALLCVCAEYNHTVPPALTNLLGNFGPSALLAGKCAGIVTYSAAWHGGRMAAAHLRGLCGELGLVTVPTIFSVGAVWQQLDEDGKPTVEGSEANLPARFEMAACDLTWHALALRDARDRAGVRGGPLLDPQQLPTRAGTLTIRRLEPGDSDAMVRFYAGVPFEDAVYYGPACIEESSVRELVALQGVTGTEVRLVAVAEGGNIVGEAYWHWGDPSAATQEVRDAQAAQFGLCVSRSHQRAGVGRALAKAVIEGARASPGPPKLMLTSQVENKKAWTLYQSLGFTIVGEQIRPANVRRGLPVTAMPEYIMELQIKPW